MPAITREELTAVEALVAEEPKGAVVAPKEAAKPIPTAGGLLQLRPSSPLQVIASGDPNVVTRRPRVHALRTTRKMSGERSWTSSSPRRQPTKQESAVVATVAAKVEAKALMPKARAVAARVKPKPLTPLMVVQAKALKPELQPIPKRNQSRKASNSLREVARVGIASRSKPTLSENSSRMVEAMFSVFLTPSS